MTFTYDPGASSIGFSAPSPGLRAAIDSPPNRRTHSPILAPDTNVALRRPTSNDAPAAIARLVDLGLEPFLITATLEAVVAQRLVRRICTTCKAEFEPTEEMLMELNLRPEDVAGKTVYYGKGCDYCNHTGYKGRLGIFEIMVMSDELRELVMRRASTNLIRAEAVKQGMTLLRESGLKGIFNGLTTLEEIVKETVFDEG